MYVEGEHENGNMVGVKRKCNDNMEVKRKCNDNVEVKRK